MQRILRRRRWWRRAAAGGAGLGALLLIGWLVRPATEPKNGLATAPARLPAADEHIPLPLAPGQTKATVPAMQAIRLVRRATNQTHQSTVATRIWRDAINPIAAHYQLTALPTNVTDRIRPMAIAWSTEETAIQQQMLTGDFGPDSTSYQTLTRNLRQWPNAVIVCDLTSSMYPYSTQLFDWFRQNAHNSAVKGIVFFTDCDSLGRQTQPGGPAGRMFVTRERDVASVLPLMLEAARNTVHNDDDAENDVEALLFAQKTFPEAKHLILLADNMSQVKDINRIGGIEKPVHVILCGTTGSDLTQPFQPDHYTIASLTKGSLHTLEDDINPGSIPPYAMLHVGTRYYRYNARKEQFRLTSFMRRPIRLFGFLWL